MYVNKCIKKGLKVLIEAHKPSVGSLTGSDIVESNPGKFKLGDNELQERRDFVERTRKSVQVNCIKDFSSLLFLPSHIVVLYSPLFYLSVI